MNRTVLPTLGAVEALRARYVSHRFAPHWHDELALGAVEGGALRTRVGREEVVAPAGSLIVLNPGDVHTGIACDRDGYAYRMVYLDAARLEELGGAPGGVTFPAAVIDDPSLHAGLVTALHLLASAPADRGAAEGPLLEVMRLLWARHATGARRDARGWAEPRLVRSVRDYLEAHHARIVSLAELAALTGRSPFHVSRTFRIALGVPPYAYLALVRVRRARALLREGVPVSMVTHATGFSDQSHFIRQFKRVVGVTPGQYAREVSGVRLARPLAGLRRAGVPLAVPTAPGPAPLRESA